MYGAATKRAPATLEIFMMFIARGTLNESQKRVMSHAQMNIEQDQKSLEMGREEETGTLDDYKYLVLRKN